MLVTLRVRLLSGLRQGGAIGVKATQGEILPVGDSETLDFTCRFAASGVNWATRYVLVAVGDSAYVFSLSARPRDLDALRGPFERVVRSLRIPGSD